MARALGPVLPLQPADKRESPRVSCAGWNLVFKQFAEELPVERVLFAVCLFEPPEQPWRSERDPNTLKRHLNDVLACFVIIDAAGGFHQIDDKLISNSNDHVLVEIAGLNVPNGPVR